MQLRQSPSLKAVPFIGHGFSFKGSFGVINCPQEANFACNEQLSAQDQARAMQNRIALAKVLQAKKLYLIKQTHSNLVVDIDALNQATSSKDIAPIITQEGDALITNKARCALAVLTADCAPLLMVDIKTRWIAAVHAGWRGAVGGIIENTLEALIARGSRPQACFR